MVRRNIFTVEIVVSYIGASGIDGNGEFHDIKYGMRLPTETSKLLLSMMLEKCICPIFLIYFLSSIH